MLTSSCRCINHCAVKIYFSGVLNRGLSVGVHRCMCISNNIYFIKGKLKNFPVCCIILLKPKWIELRFSFMLILWLLSVRYPTLITVFAPQKPSEYHADVLVLIHYRCVYLPHCGSTNLPTALAPENAFLCFRQNHVLYAPYPVQLLRLIKFSVFSLIRTIQYFCFNFVRIFISLIFIILMEDFR